MLDLLLVIGSENRPWLSELFPGLAKGSVIPFESASEARSFMQILKLLLSTDRRTEKVYPLRINVLCMDSISSCIKDLDRVSVLGKIVVITDITSVSGVDGGAYSSDVSSYLSCVNNLLLFFANFEDFYKARCIVKNLNSRTKVSIVFNLGSICQDLDLAITLQRKLGVRALYIAQGAYENKFFKAFTPRENVIIDTFCTTRWLHFDVAPLRGEGWGSDVEIYVAIPSSHPGKTVVISKSGVCAFDGESLEFLDLSSLSKLVDDFSEDDVLFVLRSMEPAIVFKIGKEVMVTEDDIELLKLIDKCKCLRGVMKRTGMSYRSIKSRICELERALGMKLVMSRRGGADRGYTELTPAGRKILAILENAIAMIKEGINERLSIGLFGDVCRSLDFP